jgi:hypothetical protein
MTNEQTIYRIKRLQQQVNSVCCKIKNISIIYQANSNTFPQNLNIGSWLIVTDDGTESGNVLEMWIFNGTTWNEVPTSSFTLPQNVVDALLNSNSPSLTNPYATLLDIPIPNDIIVVINYSALPNPTTVATKFYWVSNSQGTQWLPGSLGGTYYPKGLYYSNGVSWEYMETPYQATQLEVDTGTNNDKFVTPNTLNNSIQWNTKQNTLVSGSNIRTVNGNTLLGSTDLVISASPSGLTGEIQFNNGGAFGADSNLFWDNTNKRLGVGATPATTVRLDVRAQGALSTDIPFRVRNSADTGNTFEFQATGRVFFRTNNSAFDFFINAGSGGCYLNAHNGTLFLNANSTTDSQLVVRSNSGNKCVDIGGTGLGTGTNKLAFLNGTAPSTNLTDSFQQYSADRGGVAGKASAHFRAEDGTINVIGDLSGFGTSTPGARLDVRAQGALSTDIAFRVRNSADTGNIVTIQGNGDAIFNNITHGAIISNTNSVALGDTNLQLYTYNNLSTKVSSMISHFGSNGLNANKGVAIGWTPTTTLAAPLDVYDSGFSSTGKSVARFGNFVNLNDDNFNILFSTRYCGITSGNNLAKLQIGHIGNGTNNNARSFFKFELLRNNTLAERASITSQSNLLLQTPTEDTNDIGVIYIPNGTAPTASITDGYKQYSADITAGNAAPHFRTENGNVIKLYQQSAVTTTQGIADVLTNVGLLASSTIVPTVQSVVSATTVTPVAGNEEVVITAQAADFTIANPTGTFAEGQSLIIRIKDNGTARAITWDTNYRAIGVTLPTTTVISKTTYVGVIYNSTDTKWDVIGVTTQA